MITPAYRDDAVTVYLGDCLNVLPELPDCSVDSVVTDPPYGLEFMGKDWDRFAPPAKASTAARTGNATISTGAGMSKGGFTHSNGYANRQTPSYGGTRPNTHRCTGCNKRDQFRNPHDCTEDATWIREAIDATGTPPTLAAFQEWCEAWAAECLRVLKPGGHLLAFGGTRTWHRLAAAIEDAGFEIRDSIAWLYGSGFPKSLDVSKAIDKARDDRDAILAVTSWMADAADAAGITRADVDTHMGTSDMGGWWLSKLRHRCQCPKWEQWLQLKVLLSLTDDMDAEVWRLNGRKGTPGEAWEQREFIGERKQRSNAGNPNRHVGLHSSLHEVETITAPATDAAQQWQGWGTALKPAFEPIVVARKPLAGTVANNVLEHGCGALNIDACRVEGQGAKKWETPRGGIWTTDTGAKAALIDNPAGRWPTNVAIDPHTATQIDKQSGVTKDGVAVRHRGVKAGPGRDEGGYMQAKPVGTPDMGYGGEGGASRFFPVFRDAGRWPANVLLDPDAADELDKQSEGQRAARSGGGHARHNNRSNPTAMSGPLNASTTHGFDDEGGASRFFPTFRYNPKAPGTERPTADGVSHPTVKPLDLMRWLVRLVTPPHGLVLDPFAGTGTTAEACIHEHMQCITIERQPEYLPLITARLHKPMQIGFDYNEEPF